MSSAGRACPLAYRYEASRLCANAISLSQPSLLVAGGLYGNVEALNAILQQAADEPSHLVFNGDFHWFDADPCDFDDVCTRVLAHDALAGNVEWELANPSTDAGCGCAYPDFVDDGVVSRSNRIMARMQGVAATFPHWQARLAALPRYRSYRFAGLTVLVLHGDPASLAGWGLSRERLATVAGQQQLVHWFEQTGADVIVSTHTCLPLMITLTVGGTPRLLVNNGSAGMGNLVDDPRGLMVRVSAKPSPHALLAISLAGLEVALVPVKFDLEAWLARFDRNWVAGSDAEQSYRQRMSDGVSLHSSALLMGSLPKK